MPRKKKILKSAGKKVVKKTKKKKQEDLKDQEGKGSRDINDLKSAVMRKLIKAGKDKRKLNYDEGKGILPVDILFFY